MENYLLLWKTIISATKSTAPFIISAPPLAFTLLRYCYAVESKAHYYTMSRGKQRPLPLLTLSDKFIYTPIPGIIRLKHNNRQVGWTHPSGYKYITIWEEGKQRNMLFHRVAYALYHGIDPYPLEVDHINRVKSDNSITNLRLFTCKEQAQNRTQTVADKLSEGLYQLRLLSKDGTNLPSHTPQTDYMGGNAFQLLLF